MRRTLSTIGWLCIVCGVQFLLVDKIIPHDFVPVPTQISDVASGSTTVAPRVIDLPDSGGYVFLALGVVCLMYFIALGGRKRDRK